MPKPIQPTRRSELQPGERLDGKPDEPTLEEDTLAGAIERSKKLIAESEWLLAKTAKLAKRRD